MAPVPQILNPLSATDGCFGISISAERGQGVRAKDFLVEIPRRDTYRSYWKKGSRNNGGPLAKASA